MQSYKKLLTYWFAVIIYDLTVVFCDKYIKSWKLTEQMNGAARSGKQNIVEGSDDMGTSLKIAIKLSGTAKGSQEELIGDLEDFLRQRNLQQWVKTDPRVLKLRVEYSKKVSYLSGLRGLGEYKIPEISNNPEEAANLLLTLCHQSTYLLHRQILALTEKHKQEGGLTERLYRERKLARGW